MSATEPLRHVTVRGRHLFIPRSLASPPSKSTDYVDDDGEGSALCRGGRADLDPPSAEERRVLHELLAAVVRTAAGLQCNAAELPDAGTDALHAVTAGSFAEACRTGGSPRARGCGSGRGVAAPVRGEEAPARALTCASPPPPPPQEPTATASPRPATPTAAAAATVHSPFCSCGHTHAVACTVAVVLLSCALLRSTSDL